MVLARAAGSYLSAPWAAVARKRNRAAMARAIRFMANSCWIVCVGIEEPLARRDTLLAERATALFDDFQVDADAGSVGIGEIDDRTFDGDLVAIDMIEERLAGHRI